MKRTEWVEDETPADAMYYLLTPRLRDAPEGDGPAGVYGKATKARPARGRDKVRSPLTPRGPETGHKTSAAPPARRADENKSDVSRWVAEYRPLSTWSTDRQLLRAVADIFASQQDWQHAYEHIRRVADLAEAEVDSHPSALT